MKILAIANHKGGVGKTATARALADVLAAAGLHVLLVDTDHQGSLGLSCGVVEPALDMANVYGVAKQPLKKLAEILTPVSPNIDLAPAGLGLAAADSELTLRALQEPVYSLLAEALQTVAKRYDVALIDCPPALGILVTNALVAADSVLIPTQPQPVDVAGVRLFLDTIESVRKRLNPGLTLLGMLPTFYDNRLKTHQAAVESMTAAGWPVLPVKIPRSIRVGESAGLGQSVITFEPGSPTAAAYQELGEVIKTWLKTKSK